MTDGTTLSVRLGAVHAVLFGNEATVILNFILSGFLMYSITEPCFVKQGRENEGRRTEGRREENTQSLPRSGYS